MTYSGNRTRPFNFVMLQVKACCRHRRIDLNLLGGTTYSGVRRALESSRAGYRCLEHLRRLYRRSLRRSYAPVYLVFSKHPPGGARQPPPVHKAIMFSEKDLPCNQMSSMTILRKSDLAKCKCVRRLTMRFLTLD
jgi:hypothetical protein